MKKKILIKIMIVILICNLCGCGKENINDNQKILWSRLEKKIWIINDWNRSEGYEDISVLFTKIEDGKVEGYFFEGDIISANSEFYSEDLEMRNKYGKIKGIYEGNKAECTIEGKKRGDLTIIYSDDNRIKATIKWKLNKKINSFFLSPYNLKDGELDVRATVSDQIKNVELENWGNVKFVTRIRSSFKRKALFLYLTDDNGNILYDFGSSNNGFPNDFFVKDFLFKDINDDSKKDLLVVLQGITAIDAHVARVYEQNAVGGFVLNNKITNKLNDGDKLYNISIEKVLQYINSK